MSFTSLILIGSLFFILFNIQGTIGCIKEYVEISKGCYKIANGSLASWSQASQICKNDTANTNVSSAMSHLVALENYMERNALYTYLGSYGVGSQYWTDGILSTSIWSWSNQSIVWYFEQDQRNIAGTGSNFKLAANASKNGYLISDDIDARSLNYICEYQAPCTSNTNTLCENNATCYQNVGEDVCVCAPGFTGKLCDIEIDECLSSPCSHDGNCTDAVNSYICDCSNTFYEGFKCEIPKLDPTESSRSAAFWSVVGVISGLLVLLTLSDFPWGDIFTAIGCSCHRLTCCSKENEPRHLNDNDPRLSDSSINDHNYDTHRTSSPNGPTASKGMNYNVMNTVWDTEYTPNTSPINPQYNGYRSPDHTQIQSFVQTKQKAANDKRVYAVNINEPKSQAKDSVDTMFNWTQQLQEQLKTKKPRQTSASSTQQLIHSTNSNN